jgi:hypothetical protein
MHFSQQPIWSPLLTRRRYHTPGDRSRVSGAALVLSGLAGVLVPDQVAQALHLPASSGRSNAEVRAGLGGTYLALGAWALLSGKPAARTAVGVTWLGAAGARLTALAFDTPETDFSYWSYVALEVGAGVAAVASGRTHPL